MGTPSGGPIGCEVPVGVRFNVENLSGQVKYGVLLEVRQNKGYLWGQIERGGTSGGVMQLYI